MVFRILVLIVGVLVGIAYFTLLERKVLGYIQIRKGPNKVGYIGLLQPFRDAIKLFSKESIYPIISNYFIYYVSPIINLFFSLFLWFLVPIFCYIVGFHLGVLFFLCVRRLRVYRVIISGWSSNSNYALLGRIRSIAQTVSYEVRLAIILIGLFVIILGLNFYDLLKFQRLIWFRFLYFPLFIMWLVSGLAETNRTPFDLAEGESELVSGFNIEYRSGGFAIIFLSEYGRIIFIRLLTCLIFLGGNINDFIFFLKFLFIMFFWIWARGTLPRFRYDKLISLAWKRFLPVSLNFLAFYFLIKMIFLSLSF